MDGVRELPAARADVRSVLIERVEIIPLRLPMKIPIKIASGEPRATVDTLVVRLWTSAGVCGIGETQAWRRQGSRETFGSLCSVIRDHFSPHLVGRSPFDIAAIMRRLEEAAFQSLYAQAAISDALYDLQGKLLGVPVHTLLGGRCRDHLAGCAVLFMKPDIEETLEGADAFYARGFRSFIVKVGVDLAADVRTVAALRERFGPDAVIRVDANGGMSFDAALSLLRKLDPFDVDSAEQPLPIWDVAGLAELARRTPIPLMIDESLATSQDLLAVIRERAGTAIHTKVGKNGGLWGSRKLWTIAEAAGLRIFPGNHPSTSVATLSVVHLAAAWPGPLLEGPFALGLEALATDIVREPATMQGNRLMVPDRPGLGVDLDEDAVREFAATD